MRSEQQLIWKQWNSRLGAVTDAAILGLEEGLGNITDLTPDERESLCLRVIVNLEGAVHAFAKNFGEKYIADRAAEAARPKRPPFIVMRLPEGNIYGADAVAFMRTKFPRELEAFLEKRLMFLVRTKQIKAYGGDKSPIQFVRQSLESLDFSKIEWPDELK